MRYVWVFFQRMKGVKRDILGNFPDLDSSSGFHRGSNSHSCCIITVENNSGLLAITSFLYHVVSRNLF